MTPETRVEVTIRYFAMIREVMGRASERRHVPAGTTAGELFDGLTAEHPSLARMKPVTMLMVNQAYVTENHPLRTGDEVAFIPPVSGGADRRFVIQVEPLDARATESLVAHPGAGAVVTFIGTVRDHGRGQAVTHLEYEAYAPAAEAMLARIGEEIARRWETDHVAIAHRVGSLTVGEASVVISVASPHRDAAFDACRYAIERIKEIVPIWKKEHYAGGAVWIGSEHDYQVATGRVPVTPAGSAGETGS
jgi:molybdopterin synthase catalytic subunit